MCCPEHCIRILCGRTVQGKLRFLNLTSQLFILSISKERCKRPIEPIAKKVDDRIEMCDRDETYVMGFNIPELIKQPDLYIYKICVQKDAQHVPRVRHTYHVLKKEYFVLPSLDGIEIKSDWDYATDIFPINPNQFYQLQSQKKSIARHCTDAASKWFSNVDEEDNYFIKSQLVPEADHSKIPHKRLTFDMLNVAPQWQPFSNGQWRHIEDSIRNYINETGVALEIVTGNLGSVRCPGSDNPIYLNRGASVSVKIPKLFYKIIKKLDDDSNYKRIFLGIVNDPSVSYIRNNDEYNLCSGQDICNDLQWFKNSGFRCNSENQEIGYTYACIFDENLRRRLRNME